MSIFYQISKHNKKQETYPPLPPSIPIRLLHLYFIPIVLI